MRHKKDLNDVFLLVDEYGKVYEYETDGSSNRLVLDLKQKVYESCSNGKYLFFIMDNRSAYEADQGFQYELVRIRRSDYTRYGRDGRSDGIIKVLNFGTLHGFVATDTQLWIVNDGVYEPVDFDGNIGTEIPVPPAFSAVTVYAAYGTNLYMVDKRNNSVKVASETDLTSWTQRFSKSALADSNLLTYDGTSVYTMLSNGKVRKFSLGGTDQGTAFTDAGIVAIAMDTIRTGDITYEIKVCRRDFDQLDELAIADFEEDAVDDDGNKVGAVTMSPNTLSSEYRLLNVYGAKKALAIFSKTTTTASPHLQGSVTCL